MRKTVHVAATLAAVAVTWFALVGQLTWAQGAAGLAAGAMTLALLRFDQRTSGVQPRLPEGWWRGLVGIPVGVLEDVLTIIREVADRSRRRPARAGLVRVPVRARDDSAVMLAMLGASATPNTVVVGYSPEEGTLLVHQFRVSDDPGADVHDRLP